MGLQEGSHFDLVGVFRKHSASGGLLGSAREGKKTHSLFKLRKGREDFFNSKPPTFSQFRKNRG